MKSPLRLFILGACLMNGFASPAPAAPNISTTHQQSGYTLVFQSDDPALDPQLKERMIRTFFTVYPAEARDYNPSSPRTVTFAVESGYHGIAATAGGTVHFSADYLHKYPRDIDVITHETMHVVQGYTHDSPGWLTEGIADFARNKYGVDNAGGDWTLPDYQPGQNYTDSYRITARFLTWVEKHERANLVKMIDAALRAGTYTPNTWKNISGKALDELWSAYIRHPAL